MEIPIKLAKAVETLKQQGHTVGEPESSIAGGIIVPVDGKRLNEEEIFKIAEMPSASGRVGGSTETP